MKEQDSGVDVSKKSFFKRRNKGCPLSEPGAPKVDYKNPKLLLRFVSERGRMLPRRITYISAKKQRELKIAIKRARNLALLPFVDN
jgi:small subunit ribosomal protein S18